MIQDLSGILNNFLPKHGNWDGRAGDSRSNGYGFNPREGIIIKWPLNRQYHDLVIVIMSSQMVVSKNYITLAVKQRRDHE